MVTLLMITFVTWYMRNKKVFVGIVAATMEYQIDILEKVATTYVEAISNAGGIPIILPNEASHIPEYIQLINRCLFIGGTNDVDPSLYGKKIIHSQNVQPRKDAVELKFLDACIQQNVPVFGICRGMQLINVYFGGTLIQDIQSSIDHNQYSKQNEYVHDLLVEHSRVLADGVYKVNSVHHQAVDDLGKGLRVTGTSTDGIIEMIEHESLPVFGVEWHPECLNDSVSSLLFSSFIAHKN